MREILFRAKRIDNGEWIYWNLWGELIRESGKRTRIAVKKGATTSYYDYVNQIRHLIDESTVSQYIGLCDKNGKKIWENDIVDASKAWWNAAGPAGHDSPIIPVEWDDGYCGFTPFADYDCDCGVYIGSDDVEVIGNVFDNAELLKE